MSEMGEKVTCQPGKWMSGLQPKADIKKTDRRSAVAARKLLEIANATEAVQDGRIHIEKLNGPFLYKEGGTPAEFSAGLDHAIAQGWLWRHESGTYVKFTQAGAALFA